MKGKRGLRKRDHVVPLTQRRLAALDAVPEEGTTFSQAARLRRALNAAMSELLKGMGYSPDYATVHGFRSTFKDWAQRPDRVPERAVRNGDGAYGSRQG